ncbi:hypothetical protein MP228_006466 [Amoeboaphelidium protococcarum]|nr:hypothetical protein MP228_006466 [Amoeboaphelidium protococcarum]
MFTQIYQSPLTPAISIIRGSLLIGTIAFPTGTFLYRLLQVDLQKANGDGEHPLLKRIQEQTIQTLQQYQLIRQTNQRQNRQNVNLWTELYLPSLAALAITSISAFYAYRLSGSYVTRLSIKVPTTDVMMEIYSGQAGKLQSSSQSLSRHQLQHLERDLSVADTALRQALGIRQSSVVPGKDAGNASVAVVAKRAMLAEVTRYRDEIPKSALAIWPQLSNVQRSLCMDMLYYSTLQIQTLSSYPFGSIIGRMMNMFKLGRQNEISYSALGRVTTECQLQQLQRLPLGQITSKQEFMNRFKFGIRGFLVSSNVMITSLSSQQQQQQRAPRLLCLNWIEIEEKSPLVWYLLNCVVPWKVNPDQAQTAGELEEGSYTDVTISDGEYVRQDRLLAGQ